MIALKKITVLLFASLLVHQSVLSLALVKHHANTMRAHGNYTLLTLSEDTGARCLDGSPYVFPIWPGNPDRWTIWILGGGSCYDAETCASRTTSNQGSSKYSLAKAAETCKCMNYNAHGDQLGCTCVNLPYCDGGFFAGHLPGPYITPNGTKLWIRGHRNLNASLDLLRNVHGLAKASQLVFTGSSSGGVASILHLDKVASAMPPNVKVFGVPKGGFTLDHKSKNDNDGYLDLLSWQFHMHHMIDAIPKDCVAEFTQQPWKCMVAAHVAHFVKTPMFLLNSKHDAWQMNTILGLNRKSIYEESAGIHELLPNVTQYGVDFMNQLNWFMKDNRCESCHQRHAAYITSCICHVECGFLERRFNGAPVSRYLGRWMNGEIHSEPDAFVEKRPPNYNCDPSKSNSVMIATPSRVHIAA